MALALILLVVFVLCIKNPERVQMVSGEVDDPKLADMAYCKEQILADVAAMEASELFARGQVDDAIRLARQLYKSKPDDVKALMCFGDIFSQAGEPTEEGFQCLRKAMHLAPHSRYVRLNYARKLAEGERYEEAIAQYEILVQAFPDGWMQPRVELAELYEKNKQSDKAAEQYRALVQDPKYATNGEMRMKEGIAIADSGDINEGFAEYIRGARMEQAQGFLAAARAAIASSGNAGVAIAKLQESLKMANDSAAAKADENDVSGGTTGDEANADEALAAKENVVAAGASNALPSGSNSQNSIMLAQLFMGQDKLPEAKDVLLQAKQKDDANPELHRLLALVLERQSDADGALAEFKIATDLDNHPPE
jgi:tetratricopeptide (TPR) repeat protein